MEPALSDPGTRRALLLYSLRAIAFIPGAVFAFFLSTLMMDDQGNTKADLPELAPLLLILPGIVLLGIGLCSVFNAVRIGVVLARHSWVDVTSTYEVLPGGTSKGQPVLHLTRADTTWWLTPIAVWWRWKRFQQPQLRFAGREGRGGVVASPDLHSLMWAGRSYFTRALLRGRQSQAR